MQFELIDLQLFTAVAETGSIAKAASRSNIAASSISKRISDLETIFHASLLVRGSKGVELTPAGHALLARARGVLNQAGQLNDELRGFSSGMRGHVRVFANISAIVQFLPEALARFLSGHTEVRIHLEEHVSSVVARAVAESVADLGIITGAPSVGPLQLLPFREDMLVFIARPDHELAGRKSLRFVDVVGQDFVGLHSNSSLHYQLLREAADLGTELKVRIQVTSFDAVCAMVAAGLGVGIVPQAATTPYTSSLGLVALPLRDDWARRELHLCVRSLEGLSPAARLLLDHLKKS